MTDDPDEKMDKVDEYYEGEDQWYKIDDMLEDEEEDEDVDEYILGNTRKAIFYIYS